MSIAAKIVRHARAGDLTAAAWREIRPRRLLAKNPVPDGGGHSARRINRLFEELPGAQRYLEIGLYAGNTFENVRAPVRRGVEPRPKFKVRRLPPGSHVSVMTSDEFFESLDPGESFDVAFIDGLHTFRQTYRDLINVLRVCSHGVILLDDVVPSDEVSAMPDREESLGLRARLGSKDYPWHGDVFRVILCVQAHHPELSFRTIVGTDNPQALVWRNEPESAIVTVDEATLHKIEAYSFTEIFGQGIPDSFFPMSESRAIQEWVSTRP